MAKTLICITTYNRQESLARLIHAILHDSDADIMIFDDCSNDGTQEFIDKLELIDDYQRINALRQETHRGKQGFWRTFQDIFDYIKNAEPYDYYIILPDDVEPCPDFVNKAIQAFDESGCICLSPLLTNRSLLPGISRWGRMPIQRKPWGYLTNYFDCAGVMRREFFETLNFHMMEILPSADPYRSSGVGRQITTRLQAANKPMGHVGRTLLTITETDSQMNEMERKRHPMFADWRLNTACVDVHMASLWRGGHVLKTIESLCKQEELLTLFVTLNSYTADQYAQVKAACKEFQTTYGKRIVLREGTNKKGSNEKLSQLSKSVAPFIAFADDDIIYPQDYLWTLLCGCGIHEGAVSLHGSRLTRFPVTGYYAPGNRTVFSWNVPLERDQEADIIGSGLSLMRRSWLTDEEWADLYKSAPTDSMDDLILSCALARKGVSRWVLAHPIMPVKLKQPEEGDNYVYDKYKDADTPQVAYLNAHFPPRG